jgi:hypothetical protein
MSRTDDHLSHVGIKWRHRLSVRLSILFSVFSIVIFGLTLGYNYYQARKMIIANIEIRARNIVMATAGRVSTVISSITAETESMAWSLETFYRKISSFPSGCIRFYRVF